jgi:hypothetical protein
LKAILFFDVGAVVDVGGVFNVENHFAIVLFGFDKGGTLNVLGSLEIWF